MPDNFFPPSVETFGETFGLPPSLYNNLSTRHHSKFRDTLSSGADLVPTPKTPHTQPVTTPNQIISPNKPNVGYVDRVLADHTKWLLTFEASKLKASVQDGTLSRSDPVVGSSQRQLSKDIPYRNPDPLGVPTASPKDTTPLLYSTGAVDHVTDCTVSWNNDEVNCGILDLLAFSLKTARELLFLRDDGKWNVIWVWGRRDYWISSSLAYCQNVFWDSSHVDVFLGAVRLTRWRVISRVSFKMACTLKVFRYYFQCCSVARALVEMSTSAV